MAFIFPDDKATFTAPNGITYAWKTDHWVVQKFKGDHEVYVSPTPPDDPQEGKLWYDSSGGVIELFIYVGDTWVSCTPSSEYALEARIAANEQGIRDLWTDQQRQDFEIAGIENRVDQLEGKVGEYKYTFQTANPTPRDGQMALLKADMSTTTRWEDVAHIAFNPNSLSGEIFDVSEVVTGDVIRLFIEGDVTMQISAFEAKVVQNDSGILSVSQTVKAVGTGMDGAAYEVEHLSSFDPAGLATMDYVDAQDDLKLNKAGDTLTGTLRSKVGTSNTVAFAVKNTNDDKVCLNLWSPGGAGSQTKYVGRNDTDHWFQVYDATDNNPVTTAKLAYKSYNFTAQSDVTYKASDAHYFDGNVVFNNNAGERRAKVSNSNFDFYNLGRFTQGFVVKDKGEDIGGLNMMAVYPEYGSYSGRIQQPTDLVNKEYVDNAAGGVPIGTVVMWFGVDAPTGWLICNGGTFSTTTYPALHAHLQTMPNYKSGTTPDFQGLYPGGAGASHGNSLTNGGVPKTNVYHSQRTAAPNAGNPTSLAEIPDGSTRTFNGAGGTSAYSNGVSKVNISEGWDTVTRPPTLSVHFIIKAA